MAGSETHHSGLKPWLPWLILLAVWGILIVVINPVGEFMVNDDWSFVKCLEVFRATGKITSTGWGPSYAPGGPSLLVHLLLGDLFSRALGFSLTTLRVAVLAMGFLGSLGLMALLRAAGASPWLALLGTLTVVANPLFLAESFTYMTDITFAALAIFALLFLFLGARKTSIPWIIAGLVLTLGSILTRQIGLVILLAFMISCWALPAGAALGRGKMAVLGLGLVLIPWVLYEFFLTHTGSSPLTQHQVIYNIFNLPGEKGFPGYLVFLYTSFFHAAWGYLGVFTSPLLIGRYLAWRDRRLFRYLLLVLAAGAVLLETAIFTGLIHPPVVFLGNIIYNLGLGPVLLKDIYILGLPRFGTLPPAAYYLLAFCTVLAVLVILARFFPYVRQLLRARWQPELRQSSFLACLAFCSLFLYLAIITLTGFRDRYLIPAVIFLVIWLVLDYAPLGREGKTGWKIIPGFVLVILMGLWSGAHVHDFMEMKRSLKKAHDYVLNDLRINPCFVDGGFEFNGYYCYQKDFQPRPGLSWWWVSREDYLITLGPLPGYRVLRVFPFQGYCNPPGAVHLLQPANPDTAQPEKGLHESPS
jgi:hypothetical protein